MEYAAAETYDKVDPKQLVALRAQHAWIVEPIYRASDALLKMPFFSWVSQIQSPLEFKPAAVQLYYHSATFPQVMGPSIKVLEYIHLHYPDSFRCRQLITKALEGFSLWAAMLHSWIGIELLPKFDLNGNLISTDKQVH